MNVTTPTLGVLGGMGPAATVDFFRRLVAATPAQSDQDHVHIVIDNDPSVPDRTAYLSGRGEDPTPKLCEMAARLKVAGADVLVIACNSAIPFSRAVAESVHLPVVDWPTSVADALTHADAARNGPVVILGTTGTVSHGAYQRALRSRGIASLVPSAQTQEIIMTVIYSVKAFGPSAVGRVRVADAVGHEFKDHGCSILLACTELSMLFAEVPPAWLPKTFDTAQTVAEHAIRAVADLRDGWNQQRQAY